MAGEPLPNGYIEAGQQFDDSIKALGLTPQGLLWAWDKTIGQHVLLLITKHLDHSGPAEMFRLLTEAYNRSALPQAISPFVVRLHSPAQSIIKRMLQVDVHDASGARHPDITAAGEVDDIHYSNRWVYYWPSAKAKFEPTARSREWRRFRENVTRLAA